MADGETVTSGVIAGLVALVSSWVYWARGQSKSQHEAAENARLDNKETIGWLRGQMESLAVTVADQGKQLVAQATDLGELRGKVAALELRNLSLAQADDALR